MRTSIQVRHNIEVAHRLYETIGKCEMVHGHSMWVTMTIEGPLNDQGMVTNSYGKVLEFGEVKFGFRNFLDAQYDHHLLLNVKDPWAQPLMTKTVFDDPSVIKGTAGYEFECLPGLRAVGGDPTTENIAFWIAGWAQNHYAVSEVEVYVQETHVNGATVHLGGE